ncbi:arylalkylamine N-acetyltransferase-like 2 isoform X1 [Stomoxys calcitrans]|uniref:arylalkylamine N-acetyltransferase-like 2 isoform X1 n=1 Tax=Stomoxys calcitrans TaxID=35570 RepID=UPI0027E39589|nr:arylalkylamine N-acetyltransferase-like 2 isoform X1 [Stomoxys calcitrans]
MDGTLEIRVIQPEEAHKIVKFLVENFFAHAPLSSCHPKNVLTAEDEAKLCKCIEIYGCSIMALEGDELVGVCVALPKNRSSIDEYFQQADELGKDNKNGQILRLLGEVNRDAGIFDRYGVEEILYLFLASVATSHGGRNIATRMTQEWMRLGKLWNYQVLSMDCSSYYCARVCERLGMECLNTVLFDEYRDDSGNPIFKPALPHVAMKTFAQRL